jgi:hypothetical protein
MPLPGPAAVEPRLNPWPAFSLRDADFAPRFDPAVGGRPRAALGVHDLGDQDRRRLNGCDSSGCCGELALLPAFLGTGAAFPPLALGQLPVALPLGKRDKDQKIRAGTVGRLSTASAAISNNQERQAIKTKKPVSVVTAKAYSTLSITDRPHEPR